MKKHVFSLAVAAVALVLAGCETPEGNVDHTGTGAVAGALIGAASGAIIGGNHHAAEGALIGGALGAGTGALIGNSMDREERARLRAQSPQTVARIDQGQPLGVADIRAMSKAGISDEIIISQIRNTHTVYRLSAAEIIELHDAGVSQKVIDYMINTASTGGVSTAQAETVYVSQAPPPAVTETYVVAPGPGYVWCGGEWIWNGRWVWVSGHWARPPRPGAIWISASWSRGSHGWHHHGGYWR
jgi:outer membrane lipoprotein SlyB